MEQDKDLLNAFDYGNLVRTIHNQMNLLKIQLKKKLKYAHNGGIFEITPEFLVHVKSYYDQGIYRAVFLDTNENPILIEDVEDFFQTIIEIERVTLNWYFEEMTEIRKTRNLKRLLDE